MGRTNGHVRGYFLVKTLPSNHKEIQYSQLGCPPVLITTGFKANTQHIPIDPKETEEDFF